MRLIDADTLDEAIAKESDGYQGSVYSCGISDGLMLSRQCIEDAPTIDAQSSVIEKWIPVTERLPEERINPNTRDFEYVLCATIWGDVRPFKYGTQIGQRVAHFWNGAGYVDAYVTHWMPQPPPPAVDTEEQP